MNRTPLSHIAMRSRLPLWSMQVVSLRSTTHRLPGCAFRALSHTDSSSATQGWVSLPSTTNLCSAGLWRIVTLNILHLPGRKSDDMQFLVGAVGRPPHPQNGDGYPADSKSSEHRDDNHHILLWPLCRISEPGGAAGSSSEPPAAGWELGAQDRLRPGAPRGPRNSTPDLPTLFLPSLQPTSKSRTIALVRLSVSRLGIPDAKGFLLGASADRMLIR